MTFVFNYNKSSFHLCFRLCVNWCLNAINVSDLYFLNTDPDQAILQNTDWQPDKKIRFYSCAKFLNFLWKMYDKKPARRKRVIRKEIKIL